MQPSGCKNVRRPARFLPGNFDRSLCRRFHRHDLEGVTMPVLVTDRPVFSGSEGVGCKADPRLLVLVVGIAIVKNPPGMLGAARSVNNIADFIRFALPEATD